MRCARGHDAQSGDSDPASFIFTEVLAMGSRAFDAVAVAAVYCVGFGVLLIADDRSRPVAVAPKASVVQAVDEPQPWRLKSRPAVNLFRVRVEEFHDVDTVRGDVVIGFRKLAFEDEMIRASGFDGWEITRARSQVLPFAKFTKEQWDEELAKGKASLAALVKLAEGCELFIEPEGKDPYGRAEGRYWLYESSGHWIDVAAWAKANGHQRR